MSHWRFWAEHVCLPKALWHSVGRKQAGLAPSWMRMQWAEQKGAPFRAGRCDDICSALRRPMQRAAMADAPRCDILPGTYLCVRQCQEPGCTAASRSAMSASHLQVQRCQEALHLHFRMSVEPPRGSTCQRRAMRSRPASMRSMMKSRMVKPHSEEPP